MKWLLILFINLLSCVSFASLKQNLNWQATPAQDLSFSLDLKSFDCPPESFIRFPNIMFSSQTIAIDGNIVKTFGSKTKILSIYGSPSLSCKILKSGNLLTWEVLSPIKYFSKVRGMPYVSKFKSPINATDIINISAMAGLFLFFLILITGFKIEELSKQVYALSAFSLSLSLFYASSISGYLFINLDYLIIDKLAGIFLGLAVTSYVYFLYIKDYLKKWVLIISLMITSVIILIMPFSPNGDFQQILVSLVFVTGIVFSGLAFINTIRLWSNNDPRVRNIDLVAFSVFFGTSFSDVLYTVGVHSLGQYWGLGSFATIFLFTGSLQKEIQDTFNERNDLVLNLEKKVEERTTELVEVNNKLIQSEKLATIGTMSAGLSHELKNPLNFITNIITDYHNLIDGFFEMIANIEGNTEQSALEIVKKSKEELELDDFSEDKSFLFESMTSQLNKINQITTDFNVFTRDSADQTKKSESITSIIKSTLNLIPSNLLIASNTEIQFKNQSDFEITCNKTQIEQVVLNLLRNALDAILSSGKAGELIIEISTQNRILKISDNGGGMSEENLSKVFDPFFTTKDPGKGTGLGLSVSAEIIKNHNGVLSCHNNKIGGATFNLSFKSS